MITTSINSFFLLLLQLYSVTPVERFDMIQDGLGQRFPGEIKPIQALIYTCIGKTVKLE